MPKVAQLTFNGGEYTEFMAPRVDVAKYGKGCLTMENFYPVPFGAAMARPGTKYGGDAKYSDRAAIVWPFTFSTTTTFDIEVGHEYFRFWKDQAAVNAPTPAAWATTTDYEVDDYVTESSTNYRCIEAHTAGTFATDLAANKWEALDVLEVTTPYQEADLYQIQIETIRDVVYIVHPDYAFRKLVRYADDDWRLELVDYAAEFNYPPLLAENQTDTNIAVTSGAHSTVGSTVTLTADSDVFTSDQVGETMMIGHVRDETSIRMDVGATGTSSNIYVLGDWQFQTTGTGKFKIQFEESEDQTNWTTKRQYDIDGTANNIIATGTEQTPKYFRINITDYTTAGGDAKIEVADPFVPGLVKITGYTSATVATAEIVEPLHAATTTSRWAKQYFSEAEGHPRAICVHRNRLCIASRDIWLSQPGNYENFRRRTDADSGFQIALTRPGSPLVQWLEDLRELRVGTTLAEGIITVDNENEAFSYSNYRVRWDSNYGSKHIRAQAVNGTAIFLQPEGRTARFQVISGIEEYYDADTLTTLADHITGDGVVQTAYQRQRYPTYHGVREDGEVCSLLYEERQNIQAWYRMKTDGEIESISVTPRPDEEDRVCYVVKRTVNGATVRHIEFKALNQYRTLQDNDKENMWFVDDGKQFTGTDMTTITGLEHLEGEEVAILADGAKVANKTVASGQITLDVAADNVIVGRPYDYRLIPMYLESANVMGQSKSIKAAIVRRWRSSAFDMRVDSGKWSNISNPPANLDTAPDLQNGDTEKIHLSGDWERNTTVEVKGTSPLPLNVQAITLEFEIGRG